MSARECCCEEPPAVTPCQAWIPCQGNGCDETDPFVIPGYTSIGRPTGPTKFDGPFWVAWHNSITAKNQSSASVNLKLNAWRRQMVQENCAAACPALPTLSTAQNCNGSGTVGVRNCKRTEYIDNLTYVLNGTVKLRGGSKDQAPCAATGPNGENWPAVPPDPYPFVLTDCLRTGATPTTATSTGSNPAWWPGENRRIVPRFFGRMSVTATAQPSTDFPQVAACGTVSVVNRCTSSTTGSVEEACIDMPITIVPGHQTVVSSEDAARCGTSGSPLECGQPSNPYPCGVNNPENGASEAAWAIDVKEPILYARLTALGLTSGMGVGTLNGAWITLTTVGRIRIMFGASARIAANGVLKFADNIVIYENQNAAYAVPGYSLSISVELTLTPKWCRHTPACGCVTSSAENGPGSLTVSMYAHSTGCGVCGPTNLAASYVLGLGQYQIPICHFPAAGGLTPNCQQYPISAACAPYHPPGGALFVDFVGLTPVERAHAGWKQYRNKYDHFWCLNTVVGGFGACCAGAKAVQSFGITALCASECTKMNPAWVATAGPCPGTNPACASNLIVTQTTPAGCHTVVYQSGIQKIGPVPDGGGCNPCGQNWFQCGPMYFTGQCGNANYGDCECCNTQLSVSLPEIIIVDAPAGCSPIGTWELYSATTATMCDRSAWVEIGYAVVS